MPAFQLHFISGLPRSGSTLLSAILSQNPHFTASMTTPLAALMGAVHPKMCGGEFSGFFDDDTRAAVLRGLFHSFYDRDAGRLASPAVVFDTNRTWCSRIALLAQLFPEMRIICCVRDIGWIIDSVEQMLAKNPLRTSKIFNFTPGGSIYARTDTLMNMENGLIGQAWSGMREAWFGEHAARLIMVPYESLTRRPEATMKGLYRELGMNYFPHDYDNVEYSRDEYDEQIGMPGLHTVRRRVQYQERQPCIPPDVFAKFSSSQFWQRPDLNVRQVTVL